MILKHERAKIILLDDLHAKPQTWNSRILNLSGKYLVAATDNRPQTAVMGPVEHKSHSYVGSEMFDVVDIVVTSNSNISIELYAISGRTSVHNPVILDLGDTTNISLDLYKILLPKMQWDVIRKKLELKA